MAENRALRTQDNIVPAHRAGVTVSMNTSPSSLLSQTYSESKPATRRVSEEASPGRVTNLRRLKILKAGGGALRVSLCSFPGSSAGHMTQATTGTGALVKLVRDTFTETGKHLNNIQTEVKFGTYSCISCSTGRPS